MLLPLSLDDCCPLFLVLGMVDFLVSPWVQLQPLLYLLRVTLGPAFNILESQILHVKNRYNNDLQLIQL